MATTLDISLWKKPKVTCPDNAWERFRPGILELEKSYI